MPENNFENIPITIGPPTGLYPYVLEFCKTISPELPLFVETSPSPSDLPLDCPNNVQRRILIDGGKSVFGWQIWERYGLIIEAEFHVVWESPLGTWHDITPKSSPCKSILFLPDPAIEYRGEQIDNIRKSLNNDPKIAEYLSIFKRRFDILNEGNRSRMDAVTLNKNETKEIEWLINRLEILEKQIIHSKTGRNDLCRCGSGEKFKKCHSV